jgi:hypothetical protein
MSQVVFSPYWTLKYFFKKRDFTCHCQEPILAKNDMSGLVTACEATTRRENALESEVCILNSHIIYMTPPKKYLSLWTKGFSHGCIRVARQEILAIMVLEGDTPNWPIKKIGCRANRGVEKAYNQVKRRNEKRKDNWTNFLVTVCMHG